MAKKTITELLTEAKELKQKEIALKAEMKKQKQIIATEYADCLSPEAKQEQIAEAEKILNSAKEKAIAAKNTFKTTMKAIKGDVSFAKEILSFVNYKQSNSLPHKKQEFSLVDNLLTLKRDGIEEIEIDVSKANWQKTFKAELARQGINGNDRVADNIVYKASLLVKGNVSA